MWKKENKVNTTREEKMEVSVGRRATPNRHLHHS